MNKQVGISSLATACVLVALLSLLFGTLSNHQGSAQTDTQSLLNDRGEKAVQWIASTTDTPENQLSVVDEFRIDLPLTGRVLYHQFVLDIEGQGQLLYHVILDERGELVPQDGTEDRLWESEAQACQVRHEEAVLQLVAQQQSVPVERLRLTSGVMHSHLFTNQSYWQVQVMDTETGRAWDIAIDTEGHQVDVRAFKQAEFEAQRARYGKLDRELYYLLQFREASDLIPVLLWIQGVDHVGIDQELIRRYPELETLRVVGGRITDANGVPVQLDAALRQQMEADYSTLLKQAHVAAAQPVLDFLDARGHEAEALDLFPGIAAESSKAVILELNQANPPSLGGIYWGGIEITPQLDSTAPTIRAPVAWHRGNTGQGVTVAVVDSGPIDPAITHGALQGKIIEANAGGPTDEHAARVASIIVGDHLAFPQYRGIAYGSDLVLSVDVDNNWQSINDGLNWAMDRGAQVLNLSFATEGSRFMKPEDRVLDYLARHRWRTIVVGAGNYLDDSWNVRSPAKGYNILSVGGINDNNNAAWSDDGMWYYSCYIDPYIDGEATPGDREKPEIVAVAGSVTSADITQGDDGFSARSGTSLAAPQVTGLVAQIIEREPAFWEAWPEVIRAVIITSATHNVQGNSRLSEKDGAGNIDIASASTTADNYWWLEREISYPADYNGNYLSETFPFFASAGEKARVAICWDSNPSSDFQTDGTDQLATDLRLYVRDPNWTVVGYSDSTNNSYEIDEFTAGQTGQYTIQIYRDPLTSTEIDNYLGIAWVKDATYLPDVRGNYPNTSGWTSRINVRNDSPLAKTVIVTFYGLDGQVKGSVTRTNLASRATWRFNAGNFVPTNFIGSAIVSSGAEVSVEVDQFHGGSNPDRVGAYGGFASGSSTVHLPILHKDNGTTQ
jgi:hypothetical protein